MASNSAAPAVLPSTPDGGVAPVLQPLDAELPEALTGRSQTWLTRYRRYPVFSAPWMRGRCLAWSFWIALALAPLLVSTLMAPAEVRPWIPLLLVALQLLLPLLLGPWLALQVRRRGWPPEREWRWLCAAAIAAALLTTGIVYGMAAESVKQWLAERTGQVDAQGRRSTAAVVIGINVVPAEGRRAGRRGAEPADPGVPTAPDPPAARTDAEPDEGADHGAFNRMAETTNIVLRAALAFWLAGGFALGGWRREQADLRALQREQELAQAQAQRREAELRLSVLAAQVEPHFLFNTLAGVRSAIATDPARASEMVDRLGDYLRASIPRLRHDGSAQQATVGAQLETVRAYLGLMAARMPRLRYTVTTPPELLEAPCPPLMLISLAENAVKHGIEPKIGPALIEVRARRLPDGALALSVADDGVGFGHDATSGTGLGLSNIRERLTQLYGPRASLSLQARAGGGVVATLTLPPQTSTSGPAPASSPDSSPDSSRTLASPARP